MINTVTLGDIWECIVHNNSEGIDDVISAYLQRISYLGTVEEWKTENVEMLRGWAYSYSTESVLRSLLKTHSSDPAMQAEGQAEVDILNSICSEVEQVFPHNTPQVAAILATVTREVGWQGSLGFRVVFAFSDPEYIPANVALSVHSAPDCGGSSYTTGALQFDGTNYYTVCPPGHEPGDANIHMGLLYASLSMGCWTLPAGVSEQTFQVYGE